MKTAHFEQYRARNGRYQYRPAAGWLIEIIETDNATGFCLACAEDTQGIEPDAEQYTCPHCGAAKLYGAEALLMHGLCFDEDRAADIAEARAQGYIK